LASLAVPPLGELLDSGFTVSNVAAAVLRETLPLPKIDQEGQEQEQEQGQGQAETTQNQVEVEAETAAENQTVVAPALHHRPSIVGHFLHFLNPFRSRQSRGRWQPQSVNRPVFVINKVKADEQDGVQHGFYYVRMLASLTGHHFKDRAEAEYYWREVLEHKWYMSEKAKHDVGIRQAALDYFRRLNLLEQVETGQET
jgi:hypothetical protein